jgi:autotransporter-associated beta strand protein
LFFLASRSSFANPTLPNIPSLSTNITSFGAVGDGVSNNAPAIQGAINAVSAAGGGTVVVSSVGLLTNYLSGPITLTSKVCLQIDTNTVLRMLPMSSWPSASTPFIKGSNLHDIEINGAGTIDGQGTNWWFPLASSRPDFIDFSGCSNTLVQNVTLQNPPTFHMMLKGNNINLTIQGITINTPASSHNTDGMDLASTNVLIQNCSINCGDDNIEIGGSGVAADITISNCTFGTGHGLSIGSTTSGGVHDLLVSNCAFNGTEYGIHMKSDRDRGGLVQKLRYLSLTMTNVNFPIAIYSYYNEIGTPSSTISVSPLMASTDVVQTATATTPIWQDITISNVMATAVGGNIAGILWGLPEMAVSNFTLCNVNISAPTKTFQVYNAQAIQIIDSQLGGPSSANMLTLCNAQIIVTNSAPSTNLVTVGGLAVPPTNNSLAFFQATAAITDMNVLGSGPIALGNSTLTFQQGSVSSSNTPVSIVAASTLAFTSGNNTLNGALNGTSTLTLGLPLSTILSLQGDCSGFTGTLAITSSGTLRFNQGTNEWGDANAAFDTGASGTIDNRSSANITIFLGGLTGGSGSKLQGSSQAGPGVDTYVIGGLNSNTTFYGTIANGTSGATPHSVAVTKIGTGTFALSGNNSYSGGTTVSNGTLMVNTSAGSGTGTGPVTVISGATLGGGGIVGGPVTVNGTLMPGNGVGTLAISNSLVLNAGAVLQYALGTNSDRTVVRDNLTLDGTLNVTDAGGFASGTYALFSYGGTLTTNGSASSLAIGTTPDPSLGYAVDISSNGYVRLIVGVANSPVAEFSGSPTSGVVPLMVTFTDSSTGSITNRFWTFGDGATTNTTAGSLAHTYSSVGSYGVSLTVVGPTGTDTLSRLSYITVAHAPPIITAGASVSNALLQVGNVIVVVAGDTNTFNVGATDPEGNPLNYQWSFGDGVTNAWSPSNTVDHAYTTNCGPYDASVTISNGLATITSNFTIVVACQLNLARLAPKLNFARTNSDSCTIMGAFDLPSTPSFAGKLATLDIGGGSLTFTLPSKGSALNGRSKFSTPTFNKKTGLWKLNVSFKNGFWQTEWANYGMTNATILKPGVLVSDLPVILLLDSEAFMATTNLHYTATQGKSGTAR